ncbi:MAG: pyrimidine dimer DNA glycosylase/endonuclease V [Planctomycetota bacterium]
MNIFVLDEDIGKCARYHPDRHVVKMILESAQMLCTVVNEAGGRSPYRSTHVKHPCTVWAGGSLSNWKWLRSLALALNREYKFRFRASRDHASAVVVRNLSLPHLPDRGLTPFAQAMPEKFRVKGDPVRAYRRYFRAEKAPGARWTRRRIPPWVREGTV